MAWVALFFAGLFEIGWAVGLKYTEGFSRLWPSLGTIAAMAASFFLLAFALKSLPLGTAYAIWTGIGTIGTAPEIEVISAMVPDYYGGNMDLPDMAPGAIVYLPVQVDGAYLYLGDCHAAQGDGELCGVAIEHPTGEMTVVASLGSDGAVERTAILRTARKLFDGTVFG